VDSKVGQNEEWFFEMKNSIYKIITEMESNIYDLFVVPLFTAKNLDKVGEIVRDICAVFKNTAQIICLYTDDSIYKDFLKITKIFQSHKTWPQSVVKLSSWKDMESYLKDFCVSMEKSGGTRVKLSSGLEYTIEPAVMQNLQNAGLDVVGINRKKR